MAKTFKYGTLLDICLTDPIAAITREIRSYDIPEADLVNTTARECGLAGALCLLWVVFLESAVMRVRLDTGATSGNRSVLGWLEEMDACPELIGNVAEIFMLRDAVAHNHLWEVTARADIGRYADVLSKHLSDLSGDSKYHRTVDKETGLTPRLGLHVIPTRIDRTDAKKILGIVWGTLEFLRSTSSDFQSRVARIMIPFEGELVTLAVFKEKFDSAI